MEKLKKIVVALFVIAIAGSTFAFAKKQCPIFCVSIDGNTSCDGILQNKKIVVTPPGTVYNYYQNWDGDQHACIGTNNCTTSVLLGICK